MDREAWQATVRGTTELEMTEKQCTQHKIFMNLGHYANPGTLITWDLRPFDCLTDS